MKYRKFPAFWNFFLDTNSANYPKALVQPQKREARWVYLERKPQSRNGRHRAASSLRRSPSAGRLETKRGRNRHPPRPAACRLLAGPHIDQIDRTARGGLSGRFRSGVICRVFSGKLAGRRQRGSSPSPSRPNAHGDGDGGPWASWCGVAVWHWPGLLGFCSDPSTEGLEPNLVWRAITTREKTIITGWKWT